MTGNVVKCFVSVMDDVKSPAAKGILSLDLNTVNHLASATPSTTTPASAANKKQLLAKSKSTGVTGATSQNTSKNKNGFLERLVSLLANTKELSVRKNVAIVLAKVL